MKWFFRALNRLHIFLYRKTGGKVLGAMFGSPVLLLTTIGRKTGKQRTVPLIYTRDGSHYAVIATDYPAWHKNLKHISRAMIEVAGQQHVVVARSAEAETEQRLWAQFIAQSPAFRSQKDRGHHEILVLEVSATA